MVFWAFLIVTAIIIISMGFYFFGDGFEFLGLILWLLSSGVVALVSLMIFGGLAYANANELKSTNETRYELRALDTGSNIHGRSYFLGGGYIGEKRVLNFITRNQDGSSELGSTDASESKIWEDQQDKPYMIKIEKEYGNWWFAGDAGYRSTYEYQYHIPSGSVVESTQITNK